MPHTPSSQNPLFYPYTPRYSWYARLCSPYLEALGSPPQTEMGSFPYSGPSTDIIYIITAETVSLPRRPRVNEYLRAWHPDLPTTSRAPEMSTHPLHPEPSHGALDRTAELLAKLLSGFEDPDVTALSEAVKAKLGITEPLPNPALSSPSPGLSTLPGDLKRSRVSGLLPRSIAPALFTLALGQSLSLNYRTCL